MIITVTMNPAIDKTVELDKINVGGLCRIKKVISDAGGKGINVSKTIKELGGQTIATGFLGKNSGAVIEQLLHDEGITSDFLYVAGDTRTNMKVIESDGCVTEFNEPGPMIPASKVEELIDKLEGYANSDSIFVLAGSIPSGVDKDIYARMTKRLHDKGAKVFMDADGELFINGLKSKPDIIKPNKFELEQYFGFEGNCTQEDLILMGQKLLDQGIGMVAISLGADGALFVHKHEVTRTPGLKVHAHSTVGAGDAMVAAITYGTHEKMPLYDIIRLAVATSAGAVTTLGTKPPTRSKVDELIKEVEVQSIVG